MKNLSFVVCMISSLVIGDNARAGDQNGGLNEQQAELLGEVIGAGIALEVMGAAIEANQNQRWRERQGNWNNYYDDDDDDDDRYDNRGQRSYSTPSNNGRNYSTPSNNRRNQSTPVYRQTQPSQSQRVYSNQPVYTTPIQGEQIISSGPVITEERVISSSPVVTSERIVSSPTVKENSLPYKGIGVKIILTEEEGGAVTYIIDGTEEATIEAGEEQTLTKRGKYEIRFSRGRADDGKDFGLARYTITEGTYNFTVTEKGWDLLRQPGTVAKATSPSGIKTNKLPPRKVATATGEPVSSDQTGATTSPENPTPAISTAPNSSPTAATAD